MFLNLCGARGHMRMLMRARIHAIWGGLRGVLRVGVGRGWGSGWVGLVLARGPRCRVRVHSFSLPRREW